MNHGAMALTTKIHLTHWGKRGWLPTLDSNSKGSVTVVTRFNYNLFAYPWQGQGRPHFTYFSIGK
jgi:hypothetical protein